MAEEYLFKDESYKIIGACFEVYKEKGNRFLEPVYQECLKIELTDKSIAHEEQLCLKLEYKGHELQQVYQLDFLYFDKIILEIKAVKKLTDKHRAQIVNYLKGTGLKLGLLVNFGHYPKLEYERFINKR